MNLVRSWPQGQAGATPLGWSRPQPLMPPRIEGWPRGVVPSGNAEALLSTAVAYWDASKYRPGDRFLRNQGVGGELLDLRLGSSVVANTNDPLFLPASSDGYLYLTGVAGNSITCTAPAGATQYIAYPLDRSSSNTTGAATGGAAFTFSTTGSWRRVELLDVSNAVVAAFDGDLITSGANTSQTDSLAVAWTINRSTSGRKSVAMPSRWNGGRPCFLFGTDDYMEVQDAWQHQLLNFGQADSFTVLAVVRSWGNPSGIFHMFAAKGDSTNTGFPGFFLFRGNGTAATRLQINDNSVAIGGAQTQNISNGVQSMVAGVRNNSAKQFGISINGAAIVPIVDTAAGLSNSRPFRIGNRSSGNDFADMEFTAAAIFRRALTAAEITSLSTYWGS